MADKVREEDKLGLKVVDGQELVVVQHKVREDQEEDKLRLRVVGSQELVLDNLDEEVVVDRKASHWQEGIQQLAHKGDQVATSAERVVLSLVKDHQTCHLFYPIQSCVVSAISNKSSKC